MSKAKMDISQFIENSLSDFPDKVSSVIFTPACNYSCPACYAKKVISNKSNIKEEEVFSYLESRKKWIDGVVICGGEPTLQKDLREFIKKIKGKGFYTKLDTNGSNPEVLELLLSDGYVDYLAMDVKGPKHIYSDIIGKKEDLAKLEKSMRLASKFPDYEFRTTVSPIIRINESKGFYWEFLSPDEAEDMAKWIAETTESSSKHYLQQFFPKSKDEMIDERLSKEMIGEKETPAALMHNIQAKIIKYLPNSKIR
jgi:pyruvate formate lyase activating enzyme